MSVTASPVSPQEISTSHAAIPEAVTAGFDERWAAWQARGAAHDRTTHLRLMFVFPILAVVAAVLYGLVLR